MMNFTVSNVLLLSLLFIHFPYKSHAQSIFPPYSQGCQDDAGPPFLDDEETYGPGGKYHDGSAAYPMLNADGSCAKPLQQACFDRGDKKTAYLEGPMDCGGNGWYCRILEDPNWPQINLRGDFNFAPCNTTDDSDSYGHCHGSSDETTYYWWLRDHWFRQYNGRLRCCCGWGEGDDPLTGGRFTNRCDYRRVVTEEEDVNECRDANEDHGLSYEGGCDPDKLNEQLNKPIPENEEQCWEVQRFGFSEEQNDDLTQPPSMVRGPTPAPTPSGDSGPARRPTTSPAPTPGDGNEPATPAPTPGDGNEPTTPAPTANEDLDDLRLMTVLENKLSIVKPKKGFGKGKTNLNNSNFVPGKYGNGAKITEEGQFIRFKTATGSRRRGKKNINFKQGAISFWYKPEYSYTADDNEQTLVHVGKPNDPRMVVGMSGGLYFYLQQSDEEEFETYASEEADLWEADEWVHIKVSWNTNLSDNSIKIFVNDERVDVENVRGGWKLGNEKRARFVFLGSAKGDSPAEGVIDSFKIYKASM